MPKFSALGGNRGAPSRSHAASRWRLLGPPAPVFAGFGDDVSLPVADASRPDAVWHRERAAKLLAAHPEARALVGRNPSTALWCLAFFCLQVALAASVASRPLWIVALVAYTIGAWADINLFMLAHECNHGLVLAGRRANRWLFTFTSLPLFLSAHHAWWLEHPVHHEDMGATVDFIRRRRAFFEMTRRASPLFVPYALVMLLAQFVRSALGLVAWGADLLGGNLSPRDRTLAILADAHLVTAYRERGIAGWAILHAALALSLVAGLGLALGWSAPAYLLLSQLFMTGFLHPLLFGMVLSNSHVGDGEGYQPSSSYYGWLNRITFNFGYHTEHHDLASVPWNRLPELRRAAPELYDGLHETRSYLALAWRFLRGVSSPRLDFAGRGEKAQAL